MVAAIVAALLVFQPLSHRYPVAAGGPASTVVRPTPPKPTGPPPPLVAPGPIASVPGGVVESTARSFADVVALNFLTADQVAIYRSTGPITEVDFALARHGPNRIVTLLVRRDTAAAARQTADRMAKLMLDYGMAGRAGGPAGVHLQAADTASGGPLRRAEYASDDYAVYLEVQGPSSRPPTAPGIDELLTAALRAQLNTLPAR